MNNLFIENLNKVIEEISFIGRVDRNDVEEIALKYCKDPDEAESIIDKIMGKVTP